jgi:hypothetical protein
LGVLVAEDALNFHIVFEGGGRHTIAKAFKGMVEVADSELPADHRARNEEDWPKFERDGKRAGAKRDLPKRFDAFVKEFNEAFPDGLRSKACEDDERSSKVAASAYARTELAPEVLDDLLARGEHGEILKRTHRCLGKVNLSFPNELMKLKDAPEPAGQLVAERIVGLVRASDQTPAALEQLADALARFGAAKWPIVSLLPFLLDPERWPFVKPTSLNRAAAAMGIDVEYEPRPNARTYELIRDLYQDVASAMREQGLEPRDLIDVQTFLSVASGARRVPVEKREDEPVE